MAVTPAVAEAFVIEGARPLSGSIRVAGNKNGALPILAATLLTTEPVSLTNVPRIRDVDTMIELLADLGADAAWTGPNEVRVHAANVSKTAPEPRLCSRMRASFLLAGPLLARFGSATMAPPGGDVIGRRRLDPHMHAFAELGADVDVDIQYEMRTRGLRGASVFLDEASVMATENTVMAAVLAPGETVLDNAACEPHVQDLCRFLVSLGRAHRRESGRTSSTSTASTASAAERGRSAPTTSRSAASSAWPRSPAATSRSKAPSRRTSCRSGQRSSGSASAWRSATSSVHVPSGQQLVIRDDLGGMIPKIEDGPWPAFPSDLTSIAITVATQAFGTVLIFEKMFENRLFFTDKLVSMGARIILCDPHRAVVTGPTPLVGQRMESPDIRAGMAMLIAALCAEGRSTIGDVHQIDKGYERIDERLRALGASIERIEAPA